MEIYGIRGVERDWFLSYQSNRKQYVYLNNIASDLCSLNCGIPQGSVLGPLLFLLYINDFNRCSNIFDFHLFADDSSLFYKHKNLSTLESDINGELDNINEWLCANRLSLNMKKSNFVIFYPPQKRRLFDPILKCHCNEKIVNPILIVKEQHLQMNLNGLVSFSIPCFVSEIFRFLKHAN